LHGPIKGTGNVLIEGGKRGNNRFARKNLPKFGFDVGVAYYFTSVLGIFAEAGFDRYALSTEVSIDGYSDTIDGPFSRFFTVGISAKF
jgi:hypothetical protein